jgi:hypothetical protein
MSHRAALSQWARLPSPIVATQRPDTCWHATVLDGPHEALHVSAFWQAAVHSTPPETSVHARFWFAQCSVHCGAPPHSCVHDAPVGQ